MKLFRSMFSRKWLFTTLLVVAACGVMVRLGIWQLDRLAQRRAFNERVLTQQAAPELVLDAGTLGLDLAAMEYREVYVRGVFLPKDEVVLRNQVFEGRPGYRLLTPLAIRGTGAAVLVDRGFVPSEAYDPGDVDLYRVEGPVEIHGILRRPQSEPDFGGRPDPETAPGEKLLVWNLVNVARIAEQVETPLLPVYIQAVPDPTVSTITYPAPYTVELELTEGPHLGYAVQWFTFAAILALGYPFFIRRETGAADAASPGEEHPL